MWADCSSTFCYKEAGHKAQPIEHERMNGTQTFICTLCCFRFPLYTYTPPFHHNRSEQQTPPSHFSIFEHKYPFKYSFVVVNVDFYPHKIRREWLENQYSIGWRFITPTKDAGVMASWGSSGAECRSSRPLPGAECQGSFELIPGCHSDLAPKSNLGNQTAALSSSSNSYMIITRYLAMAVMALR